MVKKSDAEKAEIRRQAEARRQADKDRTGHLSARGVSGEKSTGRSLSGNLSRRAPDHGEFDEAVNEFQTGSDRVAAIMGVTLIENLLLDAIESRLDDASDRSALFYESGAPFGTFKAKIVAAKALGIVNKEMAHDLDIIRDIRNQFAHSMLSLDFQNEHIARAMGKIKGVYKYTESSEPNHSEQRMKFDAIVWTSSMHLLKYRWRDALEAIRKIPEMLSTYFANLRL